MLPDPKRKPGLLLITVCLAAAACTSVDSVNDEAILAQSDAGEGSAAADPASSWLPPVKTEYRIGPRDLLEIEVYELEEPDQTKVIHSRVSQTGDITMPLIGSVRAAGLTAEGLQRSIEGKLAADYLVDPSVSVLVEEFQARSVTVLGAVQAPGTFNLRENSTTLVGALAVAGGVTEKAGSEVFVLRSGVGLGAAAEASASGDAAVGPTAAPMPRMLRIDLIDLIERGDLSANCVLEDGDVVHVPPVPHFFVSGMVHRGGRFPLRGEITVLRAIAMAGGLKDEATPAATVLIRKTDAGRVTIPIDLTEVEAGSDQDIRLQPDDVVQVNESSGSRFARGIADLFRGLFHVGYNLR